MPAEAEEAPAAETVPVVEEKEPAAKEAAPAEEKETSAPEAAPAAEKKKPRCKEDGVFQKEGGSRPGEEGTYGEEDGGLPEKGRARRGKKRLLL